MSSLAQNSTPSDVVLVLTTVSAGDAGAHIAAALVDERLAACVNVLAPMLSVFRWKDAVERDLEQQLVIKTTAERVPAVQARVAELHDYELPEFLVIAAGGGSAAYLEWVRAETAP